MGISYQSGVAVTSGRRSASLRASLDLPVIPMAKMAVPIDNIQACR